MPIEEKTASYKGPPGSCDCHMHVFGDPVRYPYSAERRNSPPADPLETFLGDYRAIARRRRVVDHVPRQTRLSPLVRMNAKLSPLGPALRPHRLRSTTTCASLANPNGPATLRVHDRQFARLLSEMSPQRRALDRLEKYRCASCPGRTAS